MSASKSAGSANPRHPMEDLIQVRLTRLVELTTQLAHFSVYARGLRSTDLRILNILYDAEQLSINELARRAHVDKAWISRSVVQLLEKKLISKQRDPSDSRAQQVRLTPKSRRLLEQVQPQLLGNERALLEGIDEASFKHSLDQLLENAVALVDKYQTPAPAKPAARSARNKAATTSRKPAKR
jgi:DNA-binding MarR family transcriptional regulator